MKCVMVNVKVLEQAPHRGNIFIEHIYRCLLCKIYEEDSNILASLSPAGTEYVIFSGSHSPIWKKQHFPQCFL